MNVCCLVVTGSIWSAAQNDENTKYGARNRMPIIGADNANLVSSFIIFSEDGDNDIVTRLRFKVIDKRLPPRVPTWKPQKRESDRRLIDGIL
jgi:hypothetical protein